MCFKILVSGHAGSLHHNPVKDIIDQEEDFHKLSASGWGIAWHTQPNSVFAAPHCAPTAEIAYVNLKHVLLNY